MTYEYEFDAVLNEEQVESCQMGVMEPGQVLALIKNKLNERSKAGWEPLVPFGIPVIWFRRRLHGGALTVDPTI